MDLSKVFDTLNHELLIAKLHAYGFGRESLMLLLKLVSAIFINFLFFHQTIALQKL